MVNGRRTANGRRGAAASGACGVELIKEQGEGLAPERPEYERERPERSRGRRDGDYSDGPGPGRRRGRSRGRGLPVSNAHSRDPIPTGNEGKSCTSTSCR